MEKKNSELSIDQLNQLIENTEKMIRNTTEALESAYEDYKKPRDDAHYKKAQERVSYWDDKQYKAFGELDAYKKELASRSVTA